MYFDTLSMFLTEVTRRVIFDCKARSTISYSDVVFISKALTSIFPSLDNCSVPREKP
jgi:hypothetical protein